MLLPAVTWKTEMPDVQYFHACKHGFGRKSFAGWSGPLELRLPKSPTFPAVETL